MASASALGFAGLHLLYPVFFFWGLGFGMSMTATSLLFSDRYGSLVLSPARPLPAHRNLTGGCLLDRARYMTVTVGIPHPTDRLNTVKFPPNIAV